MQPNARFLLCLYAPIEQFVVAAIKDIYSFWFVLLMEIYIEFDLFNVIALIRACKAVQITQNYLNYKTTRNSLDSINECFYRREITLIINAQLKRISTCRNAYAITNKYCRLLSLSVDKNVTVINGIWIKAYRFSFAHRESSSPDDCCNQCVSRSNQIIYACCHMQQRNLHQ